MVTPSFCCPTQHVIKTDMLFAESNTNLRRAGDFDSCIQIGGSAETGEALSWVNTENDRYLLPGKDWPVRSNEGKVVSEESGSLVATAAAPGLTGLFLWPSKLIKDNSYIKEKRNIHTVFEHLANSKFLDVRRFFETHLKRLLAEMEKAEKRNDSKQTINQIMSSYNISTMDCNSTNSHQQEAEKRAPLCVRAQ